MMNWLKKKCLMLYAIWHHLFNFKNIKNTQEGLRLFLTLLKVSLINGCFSGFSNCTIGTKSCI